MNYIRQNGQTWVAFSSTYAPVHLAVSLYQVLIGGCVLTPTNDLPTAGCQKVKKLNECPTLQDPRGTWGYRSLVDKVQRVAGKAKENKNEEILRDNIDQFI